jgi:hypothetical protein
MHYILISKSIAPTYVSTFNKPSSGGQSFTYALHLLVQFLDNLYIHIEYNKSQFPMDYVIITYSCRIM